MPPPDLLILTAANEAQARGYELALRSRRERGLVPDATRTLVVPDCGGRRIGSGASTLLALREAAAALRRDGGGAHPPGATFARRTVWIIHSGGDARRLPAYAPMGKVFVPLPFVAADGGAGSLLELLIADLSKLPHPPEGRVVIAAGDLVVGLDGVAAPPDDAVVGVAAIRGMDVARRHGVYVADGRGAVVDFLQKPGRAEAARRGALTRDGMALVDTGLVILRPDAAARWLAAADGGSGLLAAVERGAAPPIDLYAHILSSFARRLDEAGYLAACAAATGATTVRGESLLLALRAAIGVDRQRIVVAPRPLFFHAGTTRELVDRCTRRDRAAHRLGFRRRVDVAGAPRPGRATLIGSAAPVLGGRAMLAAAGRPSLVEGCEIAAPVRLDGGNLLAGLRDDLSRRTRAIRLRPGVCLACLPVGAHDWTILVHGDDDDFKTPIERGGTWRGAALARRVAAAPSGWRGVVRDPRVSLFDVPLWPVASARRVLGLAAWMLERSPTPTAAWRRARRRTLRELLAMVDHGRLEAARRGVSAGAIRRTTAALLHGPAMPAAAIVDRSARPDAAERAALVVQRDLERIDGFAAARAATVAAAAADATGCAARATAHRRRALEIVGRAVAEHEGPSGRVARAAIGEDWVVRCTAPVRIDLAGGWSDTPPICNEVGGVVANVAVSLRGRPPVTVTARLIPRRRIELRSVDAGAMRVLTSTADVLDHRTPGDWTGLAKAALVLADIVPPAAGHRLAPWLARFGGGVEITMRSNVPHGSGLGASSILGAAILATLDRLCGGRLDRRGLVSRTSVLEQMISTRGGWQDQVGGVFGGFKIARSSPGRIQRPQVRRIDVPQAMLDELMDRAILLFTGQRRLARHVLERVVGRWLAREHGVREAVMALRDGAEALAAALGDGRFDDFAASFGRYWRLKCALDPASSTPAVEALFDEHRRELAGWGLTGAGGGGFALLIARSRAAAQRVRRSLAASRRRDVEVFEFAVDEAGLAVQVTGAARSPGRA